MMHGGGPRMYKKPTDIPFEYMERRKWEGRVGRNPQTTGWGRPKPKPKPKEKSEIDLYLERIGYERRG